MRHEVAQPDLHRSARVERAGLHADGTLLALHDGRMVQLDVRPDPDGVRRVHTVLRRIESVELVIDGAGVRAVVVGVGHRRRCELPVSVGTALALALAGSPARVTLPEQPVTVGAQA